MTIQTDIRIHDQDVTGFDYKLQHVTRWDFAATRLGEYAGRVVYASSAEPTYWSAFAADEWDNRDGGTEQIGTADSMEEAVALIHAYWDSWDGHGHWNGR